MKKLLYIIPIFAVLGWGTTAMATAGTITQRAYIFQNDDANNGDPNNLTSAAAVNTALSNVKNGQRFIVRFQVDGTASRSNWMIQYDKNDSHWRDLGTASPSYTDFNTAPVLSFSDTATKSLTTNLAGACNGGKTFSTGEIVSNTNFVNTFEVSGTKCSELAFGIRTASISYNTTYRFRLNVTNTASASVNTFSQYPTVTTVTSANDTIRVSKFFPGLSTASSGSYALSAPLDPLGYTNITTDDSAFEEFSSMSTMFFQDGAGLYKTASSSLTTLATNGSYWLVAEGNSKLIRISQNGNNSIFSDVSSKLVGFSSYVITTAIWNGTYWLIGGDDGTNPKVNRCNFDISSCSDITTVTGLTTTLIRSIAWNGTYWLIGGTASGVASAKLVRCNITATSCTSVASALTTVSVTTDYSDIKKIAWNGTYWLIVGLDSGAIAAINRCTSDVSVCTDVTPNTSSASGGLSSGDSVAWNGTYWLIGSTDYGVNLCNSDVTICTDIGITSVLSTMADGLWNGTNWMVSDNGNLLRCNFRVTECTNITPATNVISDGINLLVGSAGILALSRCTLDGVTCEDLNKGLINIGTATINTIYNNSTYWVFGGTNLKLSAASLSFASFQDKSSKLTGFTAGDSVNSVYWNGTYWVVGGGTAKVNRCTSVMVCTNVSANLAAFTGVVNKAIWNGTYWVVGGGTGSADLNRCNTDLTSCTDVKANLSGFAGPAKSVYWNNNYWYIGGGTVAGKLNRCNIDLTSCTDVSANLSSAGAIANTIGWNGNYLAIGMSSGKLNRCNVDASSCTDVSARLSGFSTNAVENVYWTGTYWLVAGDAGKINRCEKDLQSCIDLSTAAGFNSGNIYGISGNGTYNMIGGDSAKLVRSYDRAPVYVAAFKNSNANNTSNVTVTWNVDSTLKGASRSFLVEAYNFSTKKWENKLTNSTMASGSETALTASIISSNASYYATGSYTFWRLFQLGGGQRLRTDLLSASYSGAASTPTPTPDGSSGGGIIRTGGRASTDTSASNPSGGGTPTSGGGSGSPSSPTPPPSVGGGSGGGTPTSGGGSGGGGAYSPAIYILILPLLIFGWLRGRKK